MEKRGLSTIVATLIIILLVLVAVGLIWVVVRNVIQDSAEQIALEKFTLDLEIEQVQLGENQISVKLKRNAGEGDFVSLKFIVDDGDNSEIIDHNVSLKELEQRTFILNLGLVNGSKIKKIQVVPVFRLDSGKEIIGDVNDEYIVDNVLVTTNTCSTNSECDDNNAGTTNACVSGVCQYTPITTCTGGDNFCPSGCTSSNDNDCVACTTNSECNDNDAGTTDSCVSGTCQNTAITTCTGGDSFCPVGCYSGDDSDCTNECALNSHCNDNDAGTTDSCSNGACVYTPITCTGSSTQSCTIPNGQAQQTRICTNGQWGSWGTCNVVSCNSGYTQSGNSCVSTGSQNALAFPGAEGYGKYTTGGRGGQVIKVTNLNDNGAGSARACMEASGSRICVFDVSGTIILDTPISVSNGDLTIAGQTSPNGITFRKEPVYIYASNVIVRGIRSRLGNEANKAGYDSFSVWARQSDISNIIIDHSSFSWNRDEALSVVGTDPNTNSPPYYGPSNVTVQWSIMSEGLQGHAFGGFVKYQAENISMLYNLFAHNTQRNPNYNNANGHVINNVIYNWGGRGMTIDESARVNIINNYAKVGPNTNANNGFLVIGGQGGTSITDGIYISKNYHSTKRTDLNSNDEWSAIWTTFGTSVSVAPRSTPHDFMAVTTYDTLDSYNRVLANAGASFARDEVDTRIINEVQTSTGAHNTDQNSVVWPSISMGTAPTDSDNDGMPDSWETANGHNNAVDDSAGDSDADGYTNIEEYINSFFDSSGAPI